MQYAILVYETPEDFAARTNQDQGAYWNAYQVYSEALDKAEASVGGKALDGPTSGKFVCVRDGAQDVQDGPYPDTKEQLGGFFLIEAESLDEAMEWAARCPSAGTGAAEVRPIPPYPTDSKMASDKPATHVFLLYEDESRAQALPEAEQHAYLGEYIAYTAALSEAGVFVSGEPLDSAGSATSIRVRDGARDVQDGPYADTKEQLGGYYVVHAANEAEAIAWAARCPAARFGAVEVRPAMRMDG